MKALSDYNTIYFLGIGGIGMSALAQYFISKGIVVGGYDKTPSDITEQLSSLGAIIVFDEAVESIPSQFLSSETLIIKTPAIPNNHPQKIYFEANNFQILKRSQVLGLITNETFSFAVAGTHGKTTTTAILGHILYHSNYPVTAFVGGVLEQYKTNFLCKGHKLSVLEADEFDRSFLHLKPNMACITSTDADHLDIYENADDFLNTFHEFASKINNQNHLFVADNVPINGIKVGFLDDADYKIQNVSITNGKQIFDIKTKDKLMQGISFAMPGNHNLNNAAMAVAMADTYGLSIDEIKNGLDTFPGIKRRFSYPFKSSDLVVIDDYAHHPTEIQAVFEALNAWYPKNKKTVVFQPHLFSRTRDFIEDFASVLSKFDEVILLEIYPARELPILGITSQTLLDKIVNSNKKLWRNDDLLNNISTIDTEVLVMLGAGDIGVMVDKVVQRIKEVKTI